MTITAETIEKLALQSRILLDETQVEQIKKELGTMLEYMNILNSVDTDNVQPLSHVFPITNVTRPDEVHASFSREVLLDNAPEHTEETYVVPKMIE